MKNILTSLILFIFLSCQTTKIKNDTYKIAASSPELGAIGQSQKNTKQENSFAVRTLPKLENKIRVTIGIVPFNRKLNKVYKSKAKYNQSQTKVAYIDSLPQKPELVTIKILDINGFINELNALHNEDVFRLITDTENSEIITSIAVSLSVDEITKIRQSDAYYLINSQEKKYTIALYKSGKKTDVINIDTESIVGYQSSKFCWAMNQKRQWYIADIVEGKTGCNGNTKSVPEHKKNKSLFDM